MFSAWIVGLAGVWMFLTPFIGFGSLGNAWNDWILGVLVAIFAFAMIARTPWQGWVSGIVAVWLFVAGWLTPFVYGAGVWWNDIAAGIVFAICGFAALGAGRPRTTGATTTAA